MTNQLKKMHDAYLAKREASVTPNADLKAALQERLFPQTEQQRSWFMLPSFAAVAVVVLAVILQRTVAPTAVFSPGPVDQSAEFDLHDTDGVDGSKSVSSAEEDQLTYYFSDADDESAVLNEDSLTVAVDEVMLYSWRQEILGVQGSYCDETMCVNKVAPEFDQTDYQNVSKDALVLLLPESATSVSVYLRDEQGNEVACDVYAEERNPRTYDIRLCADADERYQMDVSVWYENGGDESYTYPIHVREEW